MSSEKQLILDFAQPDAMKSILPSPSILSSHHGTKWEGIHVEYHRQPPNECPEHSLQQHSIGIILSSTIGGAILNGKHYGSERWQNGQIFIAAAGTDYHPYAVGDHEFIAIALEPNLPTSTIQCTNRQIQIRLKLYRTGKPAIR